MSEVNAKTSEPCTQHLTSDAANYPLDLLTTLVRDIDQLSQRLLTAHDSFTVAERALEFLLEVFGLEQGALLVQQGSYLHPLASRGQLPEDVLSGLPITTAWLEPCYKQGQPLYLDQNPYSDQDSFLSEKRKTLNSPLTFMIYPLGETLPTRFIVLLASNKQRHWLQPEKDFLASVCRILSLSLRFTESQTRLKTLLTLQRHSLTEPEDKLLHEILLAAVQIVPGAEAGSLLLRRGKKFHFRATVGYDLKALEPFSFRDVDMLYWQHPELLSWESSEPRVFSKKDAEQKHILEGAIWPEAFRQAGRVDEIQSNLYFPIVYQGQVLAVLNLDNFHDADAFANDSLEAARMFGPPVAVLLRERRYRYLLERDSLTDPLTNLGNRRSFDQALEREITRAQQYQNPFSLLMLDLGNFKTINDTLGHAQGDAVLIEVSKTLRKVMRPSDLLFRWGGDEFAVLLLNTAYEGAVVAARRCARAIKRISRPTLPVTAHMGVATYPTCANSVTTLLQLADERLYEAKEKDITVFLSEEFMAQQRKDTL
jgi:diguanylate cyclase (GGDEF)-like protein